MNWKIPNLTPARILVLGFGLVILLGTILLASPFATRDGQGLHWLDALFEATSAVCVTGLVVVDTADTFTLAGQWIILGLIQIGGLGFMSFATLVFILIGKKINLRERLLIQESLNQISMQGVVSLVLRVFAITFILETVGASVLAIRWASEIGWPKALYYGIFHAVTAFNNAGFDLFGKFNSLTGSVGDWTVNLVIAALIMLGGLGFTVIADLIHYRSQRRLSLHTKIVIIASTILIVFGTLLILVAEWNNPMTSGMLPWYDKLLSAFFQSVTTRTAGFNTLPIGSLHASTQFLMIILMFIGASPSSTGGGIKTTTFSMLLLAIWSMIRGKSDVVIFKRRLVADQIYKSLTISMLAILLVILMTMLLLITQDASFLKTLFEVTSAFGTVGLSMGLTPHLTPFGKIILIITMFAGRLGPLTLMIALANRKEKVLYKYPEDKILIG